MRRRKRMEITIESSLQVIRPSPNHALAWCEACSSSVPWITPEEAAVLANVSTRTVYRWVEAGRLHFIETARRAILICPNSLSRARDKERAAMAHSARNK